MYREFICENCEEYLKKFFNSMKEGLVFHEIICDEKENPIDYVFYEVNNAYEKIIGLDKERFLGKTVRGSFPESWQFWHDLYKKSMSFPEKLEFSLSEGERKRYFYISSFRPVKKQLIIKLNDITERKKNEEHYKMHRLMFECAQDIILFIKNDGRILEANTAAISSYGYTKEELLSLKLQDLRHPSTMITYESEMSMANTTGILFESVHVRKDGTSFPVEISAKSTLHESERMRIHIIRDITERKKTEEKMRYLANYDSLTGIPNRSNLMEQLELELEKAGRGNYKLALMLFDIDHFKMINDIFGHHMGDRVLQITSQRVKKVIRKIDIIGRLGGDEFLIILPYINSNESTVALINRIFEVISEPVKTEHAGLNINISIGISIYPDDANNLKSLMLLSDKAMYKAKQKEGSSFYFHDNN